jgi:Fe-S oxidoreductase
MDRINEYSWCCGAGGVNESNLSLAWTAERGSRKPVTGAEALVTACPWCESAFNKALKGTGSSLKVYDIVELVAKAI